MAAVGPDTKKMRTPAGVLRNFMWLEYEWDADWNFDTWVRSEAVSGVQHWRMVSNLALPAFTICPATQDPFSPAMIAGPWATNGWTDGDLPAPVTFKPKTTSLY